MAIDKEGAWYKKIEADLKGTPPESFDMELEKDLKVSAFQESHDSEWRTGMEAKPGLANAWKTRREVSGDVTPQQVEKWRTQGLDHLGFSSMPSEAVLAKCAELGMSVDIPSTSSPVAIEGWSSLRNEVSSSVSGDGKWRPLLASSLPYQKEGVPKSTEIALTLAWAHEHLVSLMDTGKSIDEASAMVMMEMTVGPRLLSEVAAFRTLRSLWTTVIDAYNPEAGCSGNCSISAVCSNHTFTTKQSYTNLLRETASAMAAALGGVDAITLPAFGEGGKVDKARISANIQLLLKNESYLELVADPVGGSHAMEELTSTLVAKAWSTFQMLESKGGIRTFETTDEGKTWLQEQNRLYADSLKDSTLIGTTKYVWEDEPDVGTPEFLAECLIAQETAHA